jgi:uncharacterized protein (AIM24 family)
MFSLFSFPQSGPTSKPEAVKQVLPPTGAVQGSSFVQPGVSTDAPVPKTAGIGTPTASVTALPDNTAVSSAGTGATGTAAGPFASLGAQIVNKGGYDILKFSLKPGANLITNQETMAYMDGGLTTNAQLGSGGFWGAFARSFSGASALQNAIANPTKNELDIYLSPFLQGSIVQIDVKAGETWRFADKAFMACTSNLTVSGDVNIFNNFRLLFAGQNAAYTTVAAAAEDGIVWVCAYGGVDVHQIPMGTGSTVPLFINNGCFLGMLTKTGGVDFWQDYVRVGTAGGFFNAIFTNIGFVMKIQDKSPPIRPGPLTCIVLTQSLNRHHLDEYIRKIAISVAQEYANSHSAGAPVGGLIPDLFRAATSSGGGAVRRRATRKARVAEVPPRIMYE